MRSDFKCRLIRRRATRKQSHPSTATSAPGRTRRSPTQAQSHRIRLFPVCALYPAAL